MMMADEQKPPKWEELVKEPFTRLPSGQIDCILMHPDFGEIPFTADPNDDAEYGRLIHAYLDRTVPKEN